ncbi:MAG TPA: hypothetical protein VD706_01110 [Candidatus Saccharimonadales bacterium]|nr:hypothetical protein [Candidatus Saccharimonadales bacterium]
MAITRALSREERFERHVDEVTSSLLIKAAARADSAEIRLLPIQHAIEVNRKRDEWHGFGVSVVDKVVANAMSGYFVRSGMSRPDMEDTRSDTHDKRMSEESVKVLRTVMEAVGMEEGQEEGVFPGVTINPTLQALARYTGDSALPYVVTFDESQSGVAYVEAAASVIAWDSRNTLYI